MTLIVRTDRSLIRAMHSSSRFLRVEVIAPPAPADHVRPSASLAFVIDRSGSMHGTKIELAKQAVREAIGRLAANDRFAVVSYDDRIDVLAESTEATPDARRAALSAIGRLDARGNTDLGALQAELAGGGYHPPTPAPAVDDDDDDDLYSKYADDEDEDDD